MRKELKGKKVGGKVMLVYFGDCKITYVVTGFFNNQPILKAVKIHE